MSTMNSEVFEAFRSLGVTEDKALKAAEALGKRDNDVGEIKREIAVIKWMVGFVIALQVPVLMAVVGAAMRLLS